MTGFNYDTFEKDITESLYRDELNIIERFMNQNKFNTDSIEHTQNMLIKGMAAIEFASRFAVCDWDDKTSLRRKLEDTLKKVDINAANKSIHEGDIYRAFGILQLARLCNRKLNSGQLDVALCEAENGEDIELMLNAASFCSEVEFTNKSIETGRQGARAKNHKFHEIRQYVIYRYIQLKKENIKISKCADVILAELNENKSPLLNILSSKTPSGTFRKWIYEFNDEKIKLDPNYYF